jgi:hypothetical protein
MHARIKWGVIFERHDGGETAKNVSVIEEAKIVGINSGIAVGREIRIKLTDDDKIVVIKVRHEVGEHGCRVCRVILILGGRIDASSGAEILVEVGIGVESG